MDEHPSTQIDLPPEDRKRLGSGESIQFSKMAEEEILHSISAGMSLPELLNKISSALDCEIGNVVSLVSLLDDDTADFEAIAGNAKQFGLHKFCSIGIVAENHELLGTLEMYSCKSGLPSAREMELIERAGRLAAIAIEKGKDTLQDADAVVAEMLPTRKRVLEWPKKVN
jgi:hypothetical protein